MNVSLQNIAPEPSQWSLWQSVNKETKGEKCLIVLEKDVPQFFNIFCPDAQRYCSRVGGAGRSVWQGCCRCWVMGHYSRAIDFITVPLTYPSLTLSKCPCQPLIHLIPWLSILTAFGQKGQYFLWRVPELYNTDSKTKELASSKQCRKDGNMMYCNHTLPVGFIKLSLFAHSQACCKRTHKKGMHQHTQGQGEKEHGHTTNAYTCYKHPFLSLFSLCPSLWWDRGCHAVTVRGRRTNKCFPPRRCDLNGKATWQLCSERPHNQTPHPQIHTTTSVQKALHSPLHACKIYSTISCHLQLWKSCSCGRLSFCPWRDYFTSTFSSFFLTFIFSLVSFLHWFPSVYFSWLFFLGIYFLLVLTKFEKKKSIE